MILMSYRSRDDLVEDEARRERMLLVRGIVAKIAFIFPEVLATNTY